MNLFEKITEARNILLSTEMKKSGKNTYAGYSYHELRDFSDEIQKINKHVGIFSCITIGADLASIRIYDSSEVSVPPVEFCIQTGKATLKGAHEIQNRGAEVTYMRRYLYMLAYDITEHDSIDCSKPLTTEKKQHQKVDDDSDFYSEISSYNLNPIIVKNVVAEFSVSKARDIPIDQRQKFLNRLKHEKENQ